MGDFVKVAAIAQLNMDANYPFGQKFINCCIMIDLFHLPTRSGGKCTLCLQLNHK